MIEKVMSDFVALHDMFSEVTPEKERSLKLAVRTMIESEAYSYLKYQILRRAASRIERGLTGSQEPSLDFIRSAFMGEEISKSLDIKPVEPRKSYFRGEDQK